MRGERQTQRSPLTLFTLVRFKAIGKAQDDLSSGGPHEGEQWRIWFTGWDSSWSKQRWAYSPDLGVPFPINPTGYKYAWPKAYVAAITSPLIASPAATSVVVALAIEMPDERVSHAACLDKNGSVVQT